MSKEDPKYAIITALENENLYGARDAFREAMKQKIAESLDFHKKQISQNMGTGRSAGDIVQELSATDLAVINAFANHRTLKGETLEATIDENDDLVLNDLTGSEGVAKWVANESDEEGGIVLGDMGFDVTATESSVRAQLQLLSTNRGSLRYAASGVSKDLTRYLKGLEKN
tara:strand:+ start:73 stop:585 length:513 start_codon:yes stop_codon:yes gene_type:complete